MTVATKQNVLIRKSILRLVWVSVELYHNILRSAFLTCWGQPLPYS